jgi:hypothetical protein
MKHDPIMGRKIPKGQKIWLVIHKENIETRTGKKPQIGRKTPVKRSRHRNNPKNAIPTNPGGRMDQVRVV